MKEREEQSPSEVMADDTPFSDLMDESVPPVPTPRPKARPPLKRAAVVLIGLLIVATAVVFGVRRYLGPPDVVVVSDARVKGEAAVVNAPVQGKIDLIGVREGDRVERGQAVARLATTESQAEVDKAEAKARTIRAELADATATLAAAHAKMGKIVPPGGGPSQRGAGTASGGSRRGTKRRCSDVRQKIHHLPGRAGLRS